MNRLVWIVLCVSFAVLAVTVNSQGGGPPIVSQIEWSADGTQILVALQQGGLTIVDAYTQTTLLELPSSATGPIRSAVLQPGGHLIATVGGDYTLNFWDSASGSLVHSLTTGVIPYSVDWTSDGQHTVSSSIDTVVIRDAAGNPLFTVPGAPEDIPWVRFSPNGELLLLSFSAKIEVWDLSSQHMLVRNILGGLRQSVQWSADGTMILAANIDRTREGDIYNLVVMNPMTGERLRVYSGFDSQLTSARWSPDESQIIATSIHGTVYLIDAMSGDSTTIFTADSPILSADWSPYGGQVAIGASLNTEQAVISVNTDMMQLTPLPLSIIVPDPSPERLAAIAAACDAPPSVMQAITGLSASYSFTDSPPSLYAESLTTLDSALDAALDVPPGCAADLRAVADALVGE